MQRLRDDISTKDMDVVIDRIASRASDEVVKIYLDIVSRANPEVFEEVLGMKHRKTLEEVLDGSVWANEWAKEREARVISKAVDLMEQGYKPDEIRKMALA